jgi:ribonuclease P protein component
MVLWLRSADDASLKLGVVASRKVGGAVRRNRAKRRLREAFRLNRYRFAGHVDVVLVARRSIVSADWNAIVEELLALAGKAGLINATDTDGKESS